MLDMLRRGSKGETLVSEIVGRTRGFIAKPRIRTQMSVDRSEPDYTFWDHLARGKQAGYELGGLFARPIAKIDAAFVLGDGFTVKAENDEASDRINQFVQDNLQFLMDAYENHNKLGDSYIFINPDATLTTASPDIVDKQTNPLDFREPIAYTVTTQLEDATVVDEITALARKITIRRTGNTEGLGLTFNANGANETVLPFANLIGRLPVVHLANERGVNETHGHPLYDGLLKLMQRYHDVIHKSLLGVEIMGRPVPVAEKVGDAQAFIDLNKTGTDTIRDSRGNQQTVDVIDMAEVDMLIFENEGTFKLESPDSFSADSNAMLKKLFLLMLEHIGIPEWAWGGAVASSKASVEAQTPAFVRYVKARRQAIESHLRNLIEIWLATAQLTEFIPDPGEIIIEWPEVIARDEMVELNKANAAFDRGVLTDATYLQLLALVEDPQAEAEAARAEREERQEAFDSRVENDIIALNAGNAGEDEQELDEAA